MRTIITLVSAVALMAAPTMASAAGAALAPQPERAKADVQGTNGFGGKAWLFTLALASMGVLAVLISQPNKPPLSP